jgi:hypothetical protein
MQRLFFGFVLLASGVVQAQTNNAAPATHASDERNNPLISFLTPAQQDEYAIAHEKALTDDLALKAEGEKIMAQTKTLSGSAADKQAFIEMMNSHRQKLRQAMLKEDPNLGPIFAAIDKHISEAKAKQLGQVQGSTSPSSATH